MAEAGEWTIRLEAGGSTSSKGTENAIWSTNGSSGSHKWSYHNAPLASSADFTTRAVGTLKAMDVTVAEGAESDIESIGSVTPYFEWKPSTTLEDDPPPSVIEYWERGLVRVEWPLQVLQSGVFGSHGPAVLELGMPGAQTFGGNEEDGYKSQEATAHVTLPNSKRSAVVRGEGRHFKAIQHAENYPGLIKGTEQYCDVRYQVNFTPAWGTTRFMLYEESQDEPGKFNSLYSRFETPTYTDNNKPEIHGRVWAGVELVVGPDTTLDPVIESFKVRIKEENPEGSTTHDHTEAENHIDVMLPVKPDGGDYKWQKRVSDSGDDGWEDVDTRIGTEPGEYRVLWAWDSHKVQRQGGTKLWNHSGEYILTMNAVIGSDLDKKVEFIPIEGVDKYSYITGDFRSRKVNVNNSLILTFSVDKIDQNDSSQEGFLPVNAGYEESNINEDGDEIWDNHPDAVNGDRITPDDEELAAANLTVSGLSEEEMNEASWRLEFPENIKIWRLSSGNWVQVQRGSTYQWASTHDSGVTKKVSFKIEGITASTSENDGVIRAFLDARGVTSLEHDQAKITVIDGSYIRPDMTADDVPAEEDSILDWGAGG